MISERRDGGTNATNFGGNGDVEECNTYAQTFWRFPSCLSVPDEVLKLLQNGHCWVVVVMVAVECR